MAWHARLRAEEDRVSRMEQAAFKLVAAASNVLSQQGNMGFCSNHFKHLSVSGASFCINFKLTNRGTAQVLVKERKKTIYS